MSTHFSSLILASQSTWRIEVLYRDGSAGYFCGWDRGEPVIEFDRDMALEYSDVIEAALDYAKIEAQGHGFSASIEVSKRFTGHSAAARLERFYAEQTIFGANLQAAE